MAGTANYISDRSPHHASASQGQRHTHSAKRSALVARQRVAEHQRLACARGHPVDLHPTVAQAPVDELFCGFTRAAGAIPGEDIGFPAVGGNLALTGLPKHGDGRSIGPRLAAARSKQGLSQPALARKAGIDTRTLAKLEAGRGHMGSLWAVLDALDRKLEVRSGEIMRRTTPADRDDRFTPPAFLASLKEVFGPVALDPCANRLSPVVAERCFYQEDDGLRQPWSAAGLTFVNPPWSNSLSWVRKAVEEHTSGRARLIILLLKAVPAGSSFELQHQQGDILLLKRRIAFLGADGQRMGNGTVSAWPSSLTMLGASGEQIAALRERLQGVLIPRTT